MAHILVTAALLAGLSSPVSSRADDGDDDNGPGAVFVGTNHNNTKDPSEPPNQVVMYRRASDGTLSLLGYFNTGGQGSGPSIRFAGDGLGSAHSVQLSRDKRWLFVTNAGSDNISVFRVSHNGLELTDLAPTLPFPNSIAQRGILVYVLCAAGDGSIIGCILSHHDREVAFGADGDLLRHAILEARTGGTTSARENFPGTVDQLGVN